MPEKFSGSKYRQFENVQDRVVRNVDYWEMKKSERITCLVSEKSLRKLDMPPIRYGPLKRLWFATEKFRGLVI